MESTLKFGRNACILCLLLLFIVSGSVSFWVNTDSVKKVTETTKKTNKESGPIVQKADEAVVPVFTVKLCQQAFILFERCFYVISSEQPLYPNKYPIFRSAFFANIFSNVIAINAP